MRAERGFTLLEALIAFAIAALALTALLQGTLAGLRGTEVAGRMQEALARARSRLASLEAAPILPGDQRGPDGGGFTWRTRIVPAANAEGLALYDVNVVVGWRDGAATRQVQLQTRRLGP